MNEKNMWTKRRLTILVGMMVVGLVAPAVAVAQDVIVVTLRGSNSGLMADPPIPDNLCYEADLVLTATDQVIGTGIDCLSNPVIFDSEGVMNDFPPVPPGPGFNTVSLDRTTIFDFPQGTLWASGRTTVAPKHEGSPDVTHIVGDITAGGNITNGTGAFSGMTGDVRLSGAVDMTNFPADIIFDCVFVMKFDQSLPIQLLDGRFEVEVAWKDFVGGMGTARLITQTNDSAVLYFFDPDNWEMVVKVLPGCAFNNRIWVFASASTDVEYTLTVTEIATGFSKEYFNPLGNTAAAITDTDAFEACP